MKNRILPTLTLLMFCLMLILLPAAAYAYSGANGGTAVKGNNLTGVNNISAVSASGGPGLPWMYSDPVNDGYSQLSLSTNGSEESYDGTFNIETDEGTGSGYHYSSGELIIEEDGAYLVYGSGTTTGKRIKVSANVTATVTIKDIHLEIAMPFECGNSSRVTLVLADNSENLLQGSGHHAGLRVVSTASLTITTEGQTLGNGSLSAYGGGDTSSAHASAGIGGSELEASGTIIINGGTVFAKGGDGRSPGAWRGPGATGIGGAKGYACGDITITGGTVTAKAGNVYSDCAGIGGGSSASASGKITITGGTVRAYSGQPSMPEWGETTTGIGFCETIIISAAADVQAYSSGNYPAIYGTVGASGHSAYLLNLKLTEAVAENTDITVTRADDSTETFELTLPGKYKNFAAVVASLADYNGISSDGSKKILSVEEDDPDFPGTYQLPGTVFSALDVKLVPIPQEATPEAIFTATGYAGGELTEVNTTMEYSVDGGSTWIGISDDAVEVGDVTPEDGIKVYQPGSPPDTADSEIQNITVSRMAESDGVNKTDCGTGSNNDGKLTGVTAAMEYKPSAAASWILGTGNDITNLVPGVYYVRNSASKTALASDYIAFSIASSGIIQIPKPTPKIGLKWTGNEQSGVDSGAGYSLSGTYAATNVGHYAVTAALESGYEWDDGTVANINISWSIAKADGVKAPAGLVAVKPTVLGGTNGKITGTTVLMEYADNADFSSSTNCNDSETTGLSAGTYYVRIKATATHEPGAYVTVTVPAGDSLVHPFTDVKDSDWFYDAVRYVYEKGLMVGTSANDFSPHNGTTRGMIVTILHRLEGSPEAGAANPFSDVAEGKWYTEAVVWAAEHKIVDGYGNGKFGPNDPITREQMAAILFRYARYMGYDLAAGADLSGFADQNAISGWALEAMSWSNAAGLIQGDGKKLTPLGKAERCQVAAILQRFILNIAK
ncbi:MAG TPA: S-layer homology domain-containing protein [Clostridiales bacterium]|nr:S-layer homology domain-containing protein [Clostridiales bacterium]